MGEKDFEEFLWRGVERRSVVEDHRCLAQQCADRDVPQCPANVAEVAMHIVRSEAVVQEELLLAIEGQHAMAVHNAFRRAGSAT